MTIQESIILEVISRMNNGLPTALPPLLPISGTHPAHRGASLPIEEDELPTYVVVAVENSEDDSSQPEAPLDRGVYRRCMWLWIEARMEAPPSNADGDPAEFLDPHVDFIMSVMLSDEQLGGLCDRMEPDRVQYASFAGDKVYCAGGVLFRVYYLGNPI